MAVGTIGKMLVDATNLEVTSVLEDGISGRKFPSIPGAFLETLSAWVYQFVTLTETLDKDFVKPAADHDIVTTALQWKDEKKNLFETYAHDAEKKFPELSKTESLSIFGDNWDVASVFMNIFSSTKASPDEYVANMRRNIRYSFYCIFLSMTVLPIGLFIILVFFLALRYWLT